MSLVDKYTAYKIDEINNGDQLPNTVGSQCLFIGTPLGGLPAGIDIGDIAYYNNGQWILLVPKDGQGGFSQAPVITTTQGNTYIKTQTGFVKTDDIGSGSVPENISAFDNDVGYQTASQVASAINSAMTDKKFGTSTSSATITNNGQVTFTTQTGLYLYPQMDMIAIYDNNNHMHGNIISYNNATGVLVLDITNKTGSGTYTNWQLYPDGVTSSSANIVDNLTSTDANSGLSANQGRVLNENKVNKETGKGLSTNDYTTPERNKLAGIQTGATANDTDANLKDRANHTGTQAISTVTGLQTALNGKENALTKGNLTEAISSVLTITGGTNAVIGSGISIQVKQATALQSGFLQFTDWIIFNSKQNALGFTPENSANKGAFDGYAALSGYNVKIQDTDGGPFSVQIIAENLTADRGLKAPNKSGVIATTSDIPTPATQTEVNAGTDATKTISPATLSGSPLFRATTTTSLTLTSGVPSKIRCNTVTSDIGTYYNTTLFRYTPPAGHYQINLIGRLTGTSIFDAFLRIYKNGVQYAQVLSATNNGNTASEMCLSDTIYLNGTDYIEAFGSVSLGGGGTCSITSATFSAYKIR